MKSVMIKKYGRHVITIVASVMLLVLYMIIFSFSAQDGEQSSGISRQVSETCVEIANDISGQNWTEAFRAELASEFEHPIRKLAHFTEYACMGVLVYLIWCPWIPKSRKMYGLVILWVFLSAAGDEIHQLFIQDRCGSFSDVLLDTCGGIFGLILCMGIRRQLRKRNNKNEAGITF